MVTEAKKFASRLNEVLDDLGYPSKHYGRNTRLAKDWGVSTTAARKWIEGEGMPDTKRIAKMAARYRVNGGWLLNGKGSKYPSASDNANISPGPTLHQIPLLSWDALASWGNGIQEPHGEITVNTSTEGLGPRGFAVVVEGDAMLPMFPPGTRLEVDPDASLRSGCYVVAFLENGDGPIFRQYIEESGRRMLSPLNNRYQAERCGVIVGRVVAVTMTV